MIGDEGMFSKDPPPAVMGSNPDPDNGCKLFTMPMFSCALWSEK
jgi:hypothetical protein